MFMKFQYIFYSSYLYIFYIYYILIYKLRAITFIISIILYKCKPKENLSKAMLKFFTFFFCTERENNK